MNKSYGRLDDHATITSLFHAHDGIISRKAVSLFHFLFICNKIF